MVRLIAFGLLYLLALEVHSFCRAWQEGVDRFVALRNLIAISPATAHQQLCSVQGGYHSQGQLCRVAALYRPTAEGKLANLCSAPSSKLARLRRFRVQLGCRFTWVAWGKVSPVIAADSYKLSVQPP